ncbi:probable cytochrome P450 6a21 [Lucilia sericata]|uniref:probable cytochrome P450 6a21 n=1 Tax=Lucilia sericata TaxID=13632 RepID=UPI0018A82FDD|nr:probable cytochrome P450 6a21 [Lucilia sericata]
MSTTLILLTTITVLVSLLFYHVKRKLNYWQDQKIPHQKPSLIVGNFQGLRKSHSMAEIFTQHYEQFKGTGPFSGFYFIHRAAVVVLDKQLMKNILIKDFNNFTNRGLYNNVKDDPLTGRLFLLDGAEWKNMRNKLSPTFSSGKMKGMYELVLKQADQLIEVEQNPVMEIKDIMARFTTDVIGSCAFGINCNSLRDPQAEFRVMGLRSLNERRHGPLISGFMQGFPDSARKLHLRSIPDDINDFFMRIVLEILEYREQNNISSNDFLGILTSMKKETGVKLTMEQMAAQAFVFFLGGFETSSSTLGFALYELALQQQIQDNLRQEIKESFKGNNIEYEALHQLKFMGQIISETLRKYPVIPLITRQALNDYPIPDYPGYVIKKDMPVFIPIYAFHHDANYYPEPEKFKPERFASTEDASKDSLTWLPFGEGPRNCIGLRFGLMQTRVALAYLLKHFKFSVCEKTEVPLVF